MNRSCERRRQILRVLRENESRLISTRGVTGLDIGLKQRQGKSTNELAILVFVEKKRKLARKDVDFIPPRFGNVATDIVESTFLAF